MKLRKTRGDIVFSCISFTLVTLLALLCLIPFWLIISASLTGNTSIILNGYSFIPQQFSLEAYSILFDRPEELIRAYGVSTFVTASGTLLGLTSITMAGYVLNRKEFKYRNKISFFIYFTSLFSGGMVPFYILIVTVLRLQDNLLSLILPALMNPFLVILMRNFMKTIPDAILESAKIDGANDFRIFRSIVVFLIGPGVATVGLFLALSYWNNWYFPMLFINNKDLFNLQYYLYNILLGQQALRSLASSLENTQQFPGEAVKMATVVITIGPVIFLYPFVQKYFVKGITVGAVKG
jgi:putative aldouronate transport system permease protein